MKYRQISKTLALAVSVSVLAATALSGCGSTDSGNGALNTETEAETENTGTTSEEDAAWASQTAVLPSEKNEVVTIKSDPDGTPGEITSAVTLKLPEEDAGSVLQDQTGLTNIKNSEGDEEFVLSEDGSLLWQNHGEDISYEGTWSAEEGQAAAALPVEVKVTYYLDGTEKTYEEIKGCSGEVTIRFDYTNNSGRYVTVDGHSQKAIVPFLAVSAVMLDEDVFSDVEVTNGETAEMDGSQIAVGMAFPGLDEYLSLSSYEATEDMDPIADYVEITAHAENFELEFTETMISNGLLKDMEDDSFDDIDDLIDAMDDLEDASGEILDGIGQLADGADEFQDYLDQYMDGVDALAEGAGSLAEGAQTLKDNQTALTEGAAALSDGLSQLNTALSGSGQEGLGQVAAALSGLQSDLEELGTDLGEWGETITASENYVKDAREWKQEAAADIKAADQALAAIDTEALSEENKKAVEEAREYLADALQEKFPEAPELALDSDSILALTADIQSRMQIIAASADALSGLGDSITQMQTAVSQLAEGSSQLSAGIAAYTEGVSQLADGAGQLSEGSSSLAAAGHQISDGFTALTDGISELKDGYEEFDEEGIQELADLAGDDLQSLLNKVKALRLADQGYDTFSGKPEGVESSAVFLIETSEEE